MSNQDAQKIKRKRRDPVERKRVIVEAAAQLLLEEGMVGFTHRKVAALANVPLGSTTQYFATLDDLREAGLRCLAAQTEEDLRETERLLKSEKVTPETIARCVREISQDRKQVRIGALFYAAAVNDEQLRVIARRWDEGFVELFSMFMDKDAAHAIALFVDGVYLYASVNDQPADLAFLTRSIAALMTQGNDVPREGNVLS